MVNDYVTMAGQYADQEPDLFPKYCWQKAADEFQKMAESSAHEPVNRAVLFFGGDSPENNHSRYYKNLDDMVASLEKRNIKPENIIVMYADGLSNAPDQNISQNPNFPVLEDSNLDFLRKKRIAVLPATQEGLENIFSIMKSNVKDTDHTLFYAFDHGGQSPRGETLIGWNKEEILDKDFAQIVKGLPGYKTYVFSECYSGGMIKDIELDGKTCAIAASKDCESSIDDGFAKGIAESIDDPGITTYDLFHKASALDAYADTTGILSQKLFNVEHPQKLGADFSVFHEPDRDAHWNLGDIHNSISVPDSNFTAFDGLGSSNPGFTEDDTGLFWSMEPSDFAPGFAGA